MAFRQETKDVKRAYEALADQVAALNDEKKAIMELPNHLAEAVANELQCDERLATVIGEKEAKIALLKEDHKAHMKDLQDKLSNAEYVIEKLTVLSKMPNRK